MRFTLRQLLDDPSKSKLLVNDDIVRLKTNLEHLIEHEHVLTQRIQEYQVALHFGNHPDAETIRMREEISSHQTTIQQLHRLYHCVQNHEYNALSMPSSWC